MPLRDHFRPPVSSRSSWDELHGAWPMSIIHRLFPLLPPQYVAAPGVHLGAMFEIDVSAYERDEPAPPEPEAGGGAAVATLAPLALAVPTLTLQTDLPELDEYEVRIYDDRHGRRLVAAVEIVSPANKDRPDTRAAFVPKCVALLQKGVCVTVVDVVSVRQSNLYAELLELIGRADPALGAEPPHLYAVTLRGRKGPRKRGFLDAWFHPLAPARPLPTLPLWLDTDLMVPLELEPSYEDACRILRIG